MEGSPPIHDQPQKTLPPWDLFTGTQCGVVFVVVVVVLLLFFVCFLFCFVFGCLTSQQQASVSQGRICEDHFTCCHTEIEAADQTFQLTQSQYTDTGPTSQSTDPITPGAWQGSHWSANFYVTGMTRPPKKPRCKRDSNPGSSTLEADALTTRPTRLSLSAGLSNFLPAPDILRWEG